MERRDEAREAFLARMGKRYDEMLARTGSSDTLDDIEEQALRCGRELERSLLEVALPEGDEPRIFRWDRKRVVSLQEDAPFPDVPWDIVRGSQVERKHARAGGQKEERKNPPPSASRQPPAQEAQIPDGGECKPGVEDPQVCPDVGMTAQQKGTENEEGRCDDRGQALHASPVWLSPVRIPTVRKPAAKMARNGKMP